MNRSELRTSIMIILYQIFMYQKNNINYNINDVIKENITFEDEFVNTVVNGVMQNKETIEKLANENLKDWKLSRLGLTDQAILSMGIYEILYTDTPKAVVINEALELAKKYSDDKVKNMINGVLDKIYRESEEK